MTNSMRPSESQTELTQLLTGPNNRSAAGRIAREICARGAITAADLAKQTGLARSTISSALTKLRQSGIIVETVSNAHIPKDVGRPEKVVTLNPEAGSTVGIHLGLVEINIAIVDVAHNVVCNHTIKMERDYEPDKATNVAYDTVQKLYEESGLSYEGLLGVGVSVSGPVSSNGRILHSSILPRWAGENVREIFEPIFRRPVTAENESNCAAITEMTWGVARGVHDFVFVTIELGFGGAVVQQGHLVTGIAGGTGEFGHMCVVPDGNICRCGNHGCLETIASFIRPVDELSRLKGRQLSLEEVFALAHSGDETAMRLVTEVAENAGWGLSIIGTALNPSLIIIGGPLALNANFLLKPLIDRYQKHVMINPENHPTALQTKIVTGRFPADDSLRGAAGLVLRSIGDVLDTNPRD